MSHWKADLTRRNFIENTMSCLASLGLAGAAGSTVLAQATGGATSAPSTPSPIVERTLGKTGLRVPIVSMGGQVCSDPRLVQACYEAGMRLFDTAAYYQFGRNEQMVGDAISRLGIRNKVLIHTKALTPAQRRGLSPDQLRQKLLDIVDGSLRRLKTDYIDILILHDVRDPAPVTNEGIMEGMTQLKRAGKTRFVGVSTHSDMANVVNRAVESGFYDTVLTAINFTLAGDTALRKAIANAAAKGVGVIAMKTQAGGTRFTVANRESLQHYSTSTINLAALKWVLRNEDITTAIPGIANYDHLREDFSVASNPELTEQESRFLADNRIQLGFCNQCGSCLATCPEKVDVPVLMRTHMYALQYGDPHMTQEVLAEIGGRAGLQTCLDCAACVAKCDGPVDIPEKIGDLGLMLG